MDAEREEYINYQSFILTTIMGAFLSVLRTQNWKPHRYIQILRTKSLLKH